MKRIILVLALCMSLSGRADDYGPYSRTNHFLLGYMVTTATYGVFKWATDRPYSTQDDFSTRLQVAFLTSLATTLIVTAVQSQADYSTTGRPRYDLGSVGYGVLGSAAGLGTIMMFDF